MLLVLINNFVKEYDEMKEKIKDLRLNHPFYIARDSLSKTLVYL